MTDQDSEVKEATRDYPHYDPAWVRFVDRHPRIGWYICFLLALNYAINLLQLVH